MKFKKAFSVILAVAMVITLMPSMAFATTTNTVAKVPTVAADTKMPKTVIDLQVKDGNGWASDTQQIKLSFENAKWTKTPTNAADLFNKLDATAAEYTITIAGTPTANDTIVVANVATDQLTYTITTETTTEDVASKLAAELSKANGLKFNVSVDSNNTSIVKLVAKNAGKLAAEPTATATGGVTSTLNGRDGTDAASSGAGNALLTIKEKGTAIYDINLLSVTDNSVEFEFNNGTLAQNDVITLEFADEALTSGSENGPVDINVESIDSSVTTQKLTVANVGTSTTTAIVNGTPKTFPRGDVSGNDITTTIEIRETAVNSIAVGSKQSFEVRLPKGVSWNNMTKSSFSGNLGSGYELSIDDADKRTMTVEFTAAGTDDVRNVLVITPDVNISKDAAEGDIAVQIVGKSASGTAKTISDANDLVIAKYGNESVTVSAVDEIPVIVSGYVKNSKDKDFTVEIKVKENMVGSLTPERFVDFDFPEEVQITGAIQVKRGSGSYENAGKYVTVNDFTNTDIVGTTNIGIAANPNNVPTATLDDTSEFTFEVPNFAESWWIKAKANDLTFKVPVTIKADYTGDITCEVSGSKAGVETTTVTVATAESPIEVTTSTTEVKNGIQKQNVADITVVEKHIGYMDRGTTLTLTLDDLGLENKLVFDKATVTVTEGDLEIGKSTVKNNGVINIPIKEASTKASTIKITGISATLDRTLPEGGYNVKVGGDAVVTNSAYNDGDFTKTAVKINDYIKIVTPADSTTIDTKIDAKFVIGQNSYTNNGTSADMDAAPYIDGNNRTMVPIRYIANACGVNDDNITWDQATQTAIINGANTVVRVTMGDYTIRTSSSDIYMDTVAVNNNGRIYVPARYIANALGAEVAWDHATQTVTITK